MMRTTALSRGYFHGLRLTGSTSWKSCKVCQRNLVKSCPMMTQWKLVPCGRYECINHCAILEVNQPCRILFSYTWRSVQTHHLLMKCTLWYAQDLLPLVQAVYHKYPQQGRQWVKDFLALNHLEGYQKRCVTPYMHSLVFHVPAQICQFGNLIRFSGQGNYINKIVENAKYFVYMFRCWKKQWCGKAHLLLLQPTWPLWGGHSHGEASGVTPTLQALEEAVFEEEPWVLGCWNSRTKETAKGDLRDFFSFF